MKTISGRISKTMAFGLFYLVLNLSLLVANFFGYGEFAATPQLEAILGGISAIVIMILRYYTDEPMA